MNIKYITYIMSLSFAAALAGCNAEAPYADAPDAPAPQDKILNSREQSDDTSLIVCLTEDGLRNAEGLQSTLEQQFGAVGFEPVFIVTPATKADCSSKGLDRWFVIRVAQGTDIGELAERVCGLEGIGSVQYNKLISRNPVETPAESALTKSTEVSLTSASALPFNDPMLSRQWNYRNNGDYAVAANVKEGADARVVDAWKIETGHPGIIVAVIDDAVQYDHPDLAANMWVNEAELNGTPGVDDDGNGFVDDIYGYNFAQNTGELNWQNPGGSGHGTHVAGIVSAVNGNGQGICGIAGGSGNGDGVRIMSIQILAGLNGGGDAVTSARAIQYAALMGADIIQCSWGYDSYSPGNDYNFANDKTTSIVAAALELFFSSRRSVLDGGLAVFASGNTGQNVVSYPGAYNKCISVTAFAADGLPAYYTCYGKGAAISAPGGEYGTGGGSSSNQLPLILSTMPTQPLDVYKQASDGSYYATGAKTDTYYGGMQGTSMACPHVSGIAALGLSYAKRLGKTYTTGEFISLLLCSVNGFGEFPTEKSCVSGPFSLGKYQDGMGTGMIDAWKLLMNIDGTPMLTVKCGESRHYDLSGYFGGDASRLTYISCEISAADKKALGLVKDPYIEYGRLCISPTRTASAKITVKAIAGGDQLKDPEHIGGQEITREISILSRDVVTTSGGWL